MLKFIQSLSNGGTDILTFKKRTKFIIAEYKTRDMVVSFCVDTKVDKS